MNEDPLLEMLRRHDPLEGTDLPPGSGPEAREQLRRILAAEVEPLSRAKIRRARRWTPPARRAATVVVALLIAVLGIVVPLWAIRSGPPVEPATPSDGLLVFAGYRPSTQGLDSDIYVVSPDGTGQTNLTNDPANEVDPAWSPDGTQVAFARDERGDYSIYVMDADGGNPVRLGAGRQPSWSMTGDEIVYVDGTTISVMSSDGSNARPILDDGPTGFSGSPVWSPDGQRIAFLRTPLADRFGFFYLYVMDADGSNVRHLSKTTILSLDGIAWSPDDERILFTGSDNELHSVRSDGSDETILTDAASEGPGEVTGSSIAPAWSSDGAFIAFLRDPVARQDYEVFIMRADGTGVRQVTDDGIEASGLSWQPIPG